MKNKFGGRYKSRISSNVTIDRMHGHTRYHRQHRVPMKHTFDMYQVQNSNVIKWQPIKSKQHPLRKRKMKHVCLEYTYTMVPIKFSVSSNLNRKTDGQFGIELANIHKQCFDDVHALRWNDFSQTKRKPLIDSREWFSAQNYFTDSLLILCEGDEVKVPKLKW